MLIKNPDEPVCIVINKEVDPQRFEQVKKIGIAFLPAWPQGIDQYTFSRILINEIKTWQDKLKSYAAYARQPFFPGSREIKNSNVLFGKILERQDSYSVILFCLKHQSRMLQTT